MANHQISSTVHDRYHGGVKAKELHSQKHEHNHMRAGMREEGAKPGPQLYDGFEKNSNPLGKAIRPYHSRGEIDGNGHRHGEIDRHGQSRNLDRRDFSGRNLHPQDARHFPHGQMKTGLPGMYGTFHGSTQTYQVTQITITHSSVFSGAHFDSLEKGNEARQNFLDAAVGFIKNPSKEAYKSLNDAMIKLMDPKFAPAINGGAAQVSIRNVGGTTMAKFTMEVTPAPVKSLDEAREDLKKAYSSKRDGEKDIAGIRAEAYTNYIRALSEKFKSEGKISHTNNTPTTPVMKSSVIYIVKTTQVSLTSLHELKKPDFKHHTHGRLTPKEQHGFWNNLRNNHRSYVDLLRQDSKKPHHEAKNASRNYGDADRPQKASRKHNHESGSAYRNYDNADKPQKTSHKQQHKSRTAKAG